MYSKFIKKTFITQKAYRKKTDGKTEDEVSGNMENGPQRVEQQKLNKTRSLHDL